MMFRHLIIAMWLAMVGSLPAVETVTINTATTFQTIESWGTAWGAYAYAERASLRDHMIQEWVDVLGITRTRIEPPGGNSSWGRGPGDAVGGLGWEYLNDNSDPNAFSSALLDTAQIDNHVTMYYLPFKQRVEANGDVFKSYFSMSFYSTGSSGDAPPWLLNSAGEHAEFILSNLQYLRNTWGITPDYAVVMNELGYGNPFTSSHLRDVIREIGPRFSGLGLPTKIEFGEGLGPVDTWNMITDLQTDPVIWPYVGMLSYHLYNVSDPYRSYIRDFGNTRGIPRAQSEDDGLNVNILYDDLTLAEVSVWDYYAMSGSFLLPIGRRWFTRTKEFWDCRQITRYVRPGSVRVGATSSESGIRPLAFVRGGKTTVVLCNTTGGGSQSVNITGLSAGQYSVCYAKGGNFTEVGLATVGAGGTLASVSVPADAVLTITPHSGNQPPILVDWKAASTYLVSPNSSTTLLASAQDPELDALSYAWSVMSQPSGVNVTIANPSSASTAVSGLTAVGNYVFGLSVSDGSNVVTRTLELDVLAGNQAPDVYDCHNRLPVWITLPTSSTTLRCKMSDIENDPLSVQWTVLSQPSGANVVLANSTTTSCYVTGMSVAGSYEFRVTASDGSHATSVDLTVPVFPSNLAPAINSISATPANVVLPTSSTTLSASTSDPDAAVMGPWRTGGDVLTHWWSVNSAPSGANPIFGSPGSATTTVSNMTVAGTYGFTLKVIDRTTVVTQNVSVTVSGSIPSAPEIAVSRSGSPLADGGTDSVSSTTAGTTASLIYSIANSGTASLSLGTPSIAGLSNCATTVTTAPTGSVSPGNATNMVLAVTPSASGSWSCTVSMTTNDSDENPTNWTISGTAAAALAPEIAMSRSGSPIADGGSDSVSGTTAGSAISLTYLVTNSGTASLSVGTPSIGGLSNCLASVGTVPSATVTAGASTNLIISVIPTASGAWSCTITMATNDSDENPTNWTISGTAAAVPSPEIAVSRSGTPITDGGTDSLSSSTVGTASVLTYTIANTGTATLTVGAPSVGGQTNCTASLTTSPAGSVTAGNSSDLVVSITPTASGAWSCTVTMATNDSDENPTNWTISGTAGVTLMPEISVSRSGKSVLDGGTDGVSGTTVGSSTILTYQITNVGSGALLVAAPMVGGQRNCTATVTTTPGGSVPAGSTTTLVVTVTPTGSGIWSCTLSMATNDSDENPMDWNIRSDLPFVSSQADDRGCGAGIGVAGILLFVMLGMLMSWRQPIPIYSRVGCDHDD